MRTHLWETHWNSFNISQKFRWRRCPLHWTPLPTVAMWTVFRTLTFSNFLSHRTTFFKTKILFCWYIKYFNAHMSLLYIRKYPPIPTPWLSPAFLIGPSWESLCNSSAALWQGRDRGRLAARSLHCAPWPGLGLGHRGLENRGSLLKARTELHRNLHSISFLSTFNTDCITAFW